MDQTAPGDLPLDPVGLPEYAGSADTGVVESVGEHAPQAGDIVDALSSEHRKLLRVLEEMRELAEADDRDALRLRWGGVVREVLEHEVAEARVALPAAESVSGPGAAEDVRLRSEELVARLREQDEFTSGASPEQVCAAAQAVGDHLRRVDEAVVPLLAQLPPDERMRLGEDLRQVMG